MTIPAYPVQFQADNNDAEDGVYFSAMCHVFDVTSEIAIRDMLSRHYLHVVAWDANAVEVYRYDNR